MSGCSDSTTDISAKICSEINNPNNKTNIDNCLRNIKSFVTTASPNSGSTNTNNSTCNNLLLGASYITSITTLIGQQQNILETNTNNITTFQESIDQQVNPETTVNVRSQRTGIFAPPRPLKAFSVSILLGLSFLFFFIALSIVYKTLNLSLVSSGGPRISFNVVKNIAVGLLVVVILILGLKIGNLI